MHNKRIIRGEENMSNHLDYEINKELGECYLFMGDFDRAEDYYRKAAASCNTMAAPYLGLATINVQRGKYDEALVLYRKAASIENNDKALSGIGLVLMEQGHGEEALKQFYAAADFNPENMIALNCMVRLSYQHSCLDTAIPYLGKCLETDPAKEAVRVTLAGCLISLGRHEEAREHLEAVLGFNPANEGAKDLIDTMAA